VADVAITLPAHIHAVTRSRELCAQALHYTLPFYMDFGLLAHIEQAQSAIKNIAFKRGLRGMVALVHGTSRADKQWPLSHWRDLAQRLNAAGFGVALPHGNPAEAQRSKEIAQDLEHAQVWPGMSLDALTDALATCAGVIGVDSGLSHMAVALDLPHVQLYNFDTAWRTGPLAAQLAAPHTEAVTAVTARQASVHGLPGFDHDADAKDAAARQCSVFAQPTPTVDAVWQAWQGVLRA
jgi:heptosyltransferase-1